MDSTRLSDMGLSRVAEDVGVSPLDDFNSRLLNNVHPADWINPEPQPMYNLVVIGAGAGGLVSAAGAAGVGGRVALIESNLLGGDCLNSGCVPSKALLRCAKAAADLRKGEQFGIKTSGDAEIDFGFIMERMRRLRSEISVVDSADRFSTELGVDVFIGRARFVSGDRVEVDGKTLNFKKAIIATGGSPALPDMPGLSEVAYLTNHTIFNLTALPKSLAVIGAGPIGMELAQAFARFGSRVTVISHSGKVLPREDRDAAALVRDALHEDGIEFLFNTTVSRVEQDKISGAIRLAIDGDTGDGRSFDNLLVATGRKPAVEGLGLENVGVDYDLRKGIIVNDRLQSSNPDIYAVGDVASAFKFTHMADFMARIAIKNALFWGRDKVSDLTVPWCTYTDPEIAHVGRYEKELDDEGIAYSTYMREFSDVDRAVVDGETAGFVKIHAARGKGTILGATIVGRHAGDLISEISTAMAGGVSLGRLASVIHPYPTTAEAIRQCGDAFNRDRLTPRVKKIFERIMAFKRR